MQCNVKPHWQLCHKHLSAVSDRASPVTSPCMCYFLFYAIAWRHLSQLTFNILVMPEKWCCHFEHFHPHFYVNLLRFFATSSICWPNDVECKWSGTPFTMGKQDEPGNARGVFQHFQLSFTSFRHIWWRAFSYWALTTGASYLFRNLPYLHNLHHQLQLWLLTEYVYYYHQKGVCLSVCLSVNRID